MNNLYTKYNETQNISGSKRLKVKVSFNSPVILSYAIICFVVLLIQLIFGDRVTVALFSVHRSSLADPLTFFRFFGHVLGHADFEHYLSNMMYLLIVGPLLEEKYGSKNIVFVILITAFVTGLFNFIFCPNVNTLGASGVVFAFILLSSLTCVKNKEIPLTFILVAVIYLGNQLYSAVFIDDNISNISHIIGGICGCVLGYFMNKGKPENSSSSPYNGIENHTYY